MTYTPVEVVTDDGTHVTIAMDVHTVLPWSQGRSLVTVSHPRYAGGKRLKMIVESDAIRDDGRPPLTSFSGLTGVAETLTTNGCQQNSRGI